MPTPHKTAATSGTRSSARADSSARAEILDMLKDDHKRVKKAFREFAKLDPQDDAQECRQIVLQTLAELKLHTALEEELVYPAARELLKEPDLVDEAEVEHASAKQLIEQLERMTPDDAKYAATFTVLGEYVNHHVKEEENEMFPQLERAKTDWQSLCDQINGRREELTQQLLPADGDEDVPERGRDDAASRRASGSGAMRSRALAGEQRAQAASRSQSDDDDES